LAARHPRWALGFADEVWWSRLAQPNLHTWADAGRELRLLHKCLAKGDPEPKALACYGLLVRLVPTTAEQVWLRFATGQPRSDLTIQFLAWCSERLQRLGQQALLLIWDNATWHTSQAVRQWLRTHNRMVKQTQQGVRIVSCRLPLQSPWLNPIEPRWVHGKRAVLEPQRALTAIELETRVYAYYGCQSEPHLSISQKVA
jgi:transposase